MLPAETTPAPVMVPRGLIDGSLPGAVQPRTAVSAYGEWNLSAWSSSPVAFGSATPFPFRLQIEAR